jgi:hypothetical protein
MPLTNPSTNPFWYDGWACRNSAPLMPACAAVPYDNAMLSSVIPSSHTLLFIGDLLY